MSGIPDKADMLELPDAAAWERWLESNHHDSGGVWLKIAKKNADCRTVTYAEALDVALCFGWIDAQKRPLDERFWLQRFTPRGPRSRWSQVNREHVERLAAAGRLRPTGVAAADAAKADGRWDAAYAPQSRATVPADFQRALDRNLAAKEFFDTLRSGERYSFIYRVEDAKRPETRARRIEEYVAKLAEGRKSP